MMSATTSSHPFQHSSTKVKPSTEPIVNTPERPLNGYSICHRLSNWNHRHGISKDCCYYRDHSLLHQSFEACVHAEEYIDESSLVFCYFASISKDYFHPNISVGKYFEGKN